jgi:hypothetical protein
MLERLQAKRAVLVAQRDQLTANLNATLGAIAICDELLAESAKEQETQKQEAADAAYRENL